jgi:hypothetical protein
MNVFDWKIAISIEYFHGKTKFTTLAHGWKKKPTIFHNLVHFPARIESNSTYKSYHFIGKSHKQYCLKVFLPASFVFDHD